MNKIGIISGNGDLPLCIGKNLINKNYNICFFCIKNFANTDKYENFENVEIELTSFSKILKLLSEKEVSEIIMVGGISRPSINDIIFDFNTLGLIKDYFLESKGDDQLLQIISNFFLKKGFPLFDWKKNCTDLFSSEDNLSHTKPSKYAIKNMHKGLNAFKIVGTADIGQSIIIQNQLILGVESIEGTDELIRRCEIYKKDGDKGILLKLSKYKQDGKLDLPTIGLETVKILFKCNYEGVFIEKNKCVIIEKEKVIKFCNENQLFLSTVKKID
jgi:DUF1009 family protein